VKHIVSYSGGACSFWAAKRVIDKYGPEDVTLLFADTLIEDESLYEFNALVEMFFGIRLTIIADGRTPWEVFRDNKMIGNSRADMCSRVLKRDLLWKWIKKNCDPKDTVVYLGLDWNEEHRLVRVRARNPKWHIEAPMTEAPFWEKDRMLSELQNLGFPLPRLYQLGFPHNNCGGFCIKAGQGHFAHLLKTLPDVFAFHKEEEKKMRSFLGKDVSVLRDRKKGKTKPLTLEDLEKRILEKQKVDLLDWGGCGCSH
jgi:3'-phosphoadenosine 5'-phosphosulfate sulfotransferase (PAPS reductase)/FAD synthetase